MKRISIHPAGLLAVLLAPIAAADPMVGNPPLGTFSLNLRLRSESVEQSGLRDAEALTLRMRLGFTTTSVHGWQSVIEGEAIVAADGDSYSQAGINQGGAGRAVVADPEGLDLNQAFLRDVMGATTFTLGRQRLILDNARFIGDVGWRQNSQSFDAFGVQDKNLPDTTLTYAYLNRVNRVFGDRHPQGYWRANSHLFNAAYTGLKGLTVTSYAYLLDFRTSATNSCATYGASVAGTEKLWGNLRFDFRAEAANQTDYGRSPLRYSASYSLVEAGLAGGPGGLTLGHEVLGSDNGTGFKTPLATLHAFNGWADLFLTTPATGLRDDYVKATAKLPAKLSFIALYHWFDGAGTGPRLGRESDLQLSRIFTAHFTAMLKFARFTRDFSAYPDVRKIWAQLEYTY